MSRCGVQPQPRRIVIHYMVLLGETASSYVATFPIAGKAPAACGQADIAACCPAAALRAVVPWEGITSCSCQTIVYVLRRWLCWPSSFTKQLKTQVLQQPA